MPLLDNTLGVNSLCLSSITYEKGLLGIFFLCRVRLGGSDFMLKEPPLSYAGLDVQLGRSHVCKTISKVVKRGNKWRRLRETLNY